MAIRLSAKTICPRCHESGHIKKILYGLPDKAYSTDKYILGGCCIDEFSPEIACAACGWSGMKTEIQPN